MVPGVAITVASGFTFQDAVGGVGDAWSCVAGIGFQKQVLFGKFRNLGPDQVGESGQGDHEDVL